MRKILTALVAASAIGAATLATSGSAEARWGWWGPGAVFGGLAAGAIVGGALAAPYYYPYGYYRYPAYYPYPAYGPYPYRPCRVRNVWNGYAWVRACY